MRILLRTTVWMLAILAISSTTIYCMKNFLTNTFNPAMGGNEFRNLEAELHKKLNQLKKEYQLFVDKYEKINSKLPGLAVPEANNIKRQLKNELDDLDLINSLEETKDIAMILMQRASKDFVKETEETYKKNVSGVGLDPKKGYEYLGLTPKASYNEIKNVIANRKKTASPKEQSQLRQVEYFFKTPYSKEQYDKYLQGRLNDLRVDDKDGSKVQQIMDKLFIPLSTMKQELITIDIKLG